jgi:hypothetical protein
MKTKSWRDKPQERRLRTELDTRDVPVALEIPFPLVPPDAQPVIRRLHGHLHVFGSFQFDHHEAALSRDAEQIEHTAVAGRKCGQLRIEKTRIEAGVEARGIFQEQGLQPALGSSAVEAMLRVGGE